jgi:ribose transport system ATP-binding protein
VAVLKLENISKSFPGIKALDSVTLTINEGEVHALVGENGAGKSTLMNILSGNLQADQGSITLNGSPISIATPRHAQAHGISIVHQELSLSENLSVAENIFPEKQPLNSFGFIDYRALHQRAQDLLKRLEIASIKSSVMVSELSSAQKQMIEIAKALATPCKILILDEPTASISYQEVGIVFKIIDELRKQGTSVIYISHRMHEITSVSDRISVLKDGRLQGTISTKDVTVDRIISMMVGREIKYNEYQSNRREDIALSARSLSGAGFTNVTFDLYKGEILGFSGLVGAGRTEMARAIFGDAKVSTGDVIKGMKTVTASHPKNAIANGIAYLPEERKTLGIFPDMSVAENMTVSSQHRYWRQTEAKTKCEEYVRLLNIKVQKLHQKISTLSGGNQQKVILARWLMTYPDVLIIDEPTHGIDVGSKFEIYELLRSLSRDGMSIIVISSELPELLQVSDRIAVMYKGELRKVLDRQEASEESVMHIASGIV